LKRAARVRKDNMERDINKGIHIQPKTVNQQKLLDAIEHYPLVVTLGAAGVGKTYCAASKVAQLYRRGKYDNIILTRSNVPTGRSLGAFPGTVEEKLAPWLMPLTTVLEQQLGKTHYENLFNTRRIQMQPLETIRGRSFENSLILVDECQNLTIEELKAITTRLGENSKMILMGDASQSDINKGKDILKFCSVCDRHNIELPIIQFTVDDIVRSDIVGQLVRAFIKENI
jgi:phosphate starvation-inducible protein PhoH and related proteins